MGKRRKGRRRARPAKRAKPTPKRDCATFIDHERFGRIPLVPCEYIGPNGERHEYLDYDPSYRPPLPVGAVRGDIRKQVHCCDMPRYSHEDQSRVCVQCGEDFTFRAREQRYWYETLKFPLYSIAIRCVDCRKQRRSNNALRQTLEASVCMVRDAPEDPSALLALAEATVAFAERFGHGDLDRAIAAVRKVQRLEPQLVEGVYWEARLQALAGRAARSRSLFAQVMQAAERRPFLRGFARDAARRTT